MTREEKLFLTLVCIKSLNNPTITRIQKSLFVYTKEYDENLFIYVPNNYGANSFDLRDEITFLISSKYLKEDKTAGFVRYDLTQKSIDLLNTKELTKKYVREQNILEQMMKYINMTGKWLLDYVYRWYPKYTEKSLIAHDVIERMTDERKQDADLIIKELKRKLQEINS